MGEELDYLFLHLKKYLDEAARNLHVRQNHTGIPSECNSGHSVGSFLESCRSHGSFMTQIKSSQDPAISSLTTHNDTIGAQWNHEEDAAELSGDWWQGCKDRNNETLM